MRLNHFLTTLSQFDILFHVIQSKSPQNQRCSAPKTQNVSELRKSALNSADLKMILSETILISNEFVTSGSETIRDD